MPDLHGTADEFRRHKYAVLRSFLDPAALAFYYQSALKRAESGAMNLADVAVPGTPASYGDPVMEMLLAQLVPRVEAASGHKVWPTYAYFRVYKTGDVLARHHDRPSCEISLTLTLGYRAGGPWPFWLEGPAGAARVDLHPGDAVLYRGIECPHWRDAFEGEHIAQVFLHYVDQDGPHAGWRFDKRPRLTSLRSLAVG
jgi:hypothetical protein